MKTRRFFHTALVVGLLFLFPLTTCSSHRSHDAARVGRGDDVDRATAPRRFCDVDESEIDRLVDRMTLDEKVAQMYIVGVTVFPWFELQKPYHLVKELGVGGVFVRPLSGVGFWPEWTARNMNKLQTLAMSRKNPIPLLIAVDQEGGIPQAMSELTGGTDQPGNMGLGATFDPSSTYASYSLMGRELSAVGINAAFAPVAGLMSSHEETSMYTRCFGELPSAVSSHVEQAVLGLQENGVVAAAKHFPSHSVAPGDEHFVLPVNGDDEQTVRSLYLPPFVAAIDAGVDMVMVTHAVFSAWEDGVPTVFSRRILGGLLRGELGFRGLIITDDINMGSIMLHEWGELPDVMAISAGADMLVDCAADSKPMFGVAEGNRRFPYGVAGQIDYVARAVREGRLSEERIDESVRRILRVKMKYCLFENPYVDISRVDDRVHTQKHIDASLELHYKAVTLVRDDGGLIPIPSEGKRRIHVVCPTSYQKEMYPHAAWGNIAGTDLFKEMKKIEPNTTGDTFVVGSPRIKVDKLVRKAEKSGADLLVVGTYNALYYEQQVELVRRLLALGMPTIVVATAMPYDLMAFPKVSTYIVTYSNRDLALEAVVRVLFGLAEPKGRLPVSIPGLYEAGWSARSGR